MSAHPFFYANDTSKTAIYTITVAILYRAAIMVKKMIYQGGNVSGNTAVSWPSLSENATESDGSTGEPEAVWLKADGTTGGQGSFADAVRNVPARGTNLYRKWRPAVSGQCYSGRWQKRGGLRISSAYLCAECRCYTGTGRGFTECGESI